jgi:AcrR family transcriptional regulator
MSNKRQDPRFARTELLLRTALMDEVAQHGFDSVKVDELCKAAGINRATFYLHYRDKFELLEVCMQSFFEVVTKPLSEAVMTDVTPLLPGLFRTVAENCYAHRGFILGILEDGKFPAFHALFTKRMSYEVGRLIEQLEKEGRASASSSKEHQVMFLSSAFFGSLLHWIKSGTLDEVDTFCRDMTASTMAVLLRQQPCAVAR